MAMHGPRLPIPPEPRFRPDGQRLLEAVLAAPADDGARLILAEWLEHDGDEPEWAEFIRCQIEQVRPVNVTKADLERELYRGQAGEEAWAREEGRRGQLGQRAAELLKAHRFRWLRTNVAGLTDYRGLPAEAWPCPFVFRRGLPAEVRLPWDLWIEGQALLLSTWPLEGVELTSPPRLAWLDVTYPPLGPDDRAEGRQGSFAGTPRKGWARFQFDGDCGCGMLEGLFLPLDGWISPAPLLEARWPGLAFRLPRGLELIPLSPSFAADGQGRGLAEGYLLRDTGQLRPSVGRGGRPPWAGSGFVFE